MTLQILDDVEVNLIDTFGTDDSIIQAAQVSVKGENEPGITDERRAGLINYLMKNRHGSPFEMASMKFFVKAPITVFREFQRHRIFSYNEMSARYSVLPDDFYIPSVARPLVNEGKSAHPKLVPGTAYQHQIVQDELLKSYEQGWSSYQTMLDHGIANEVARHALPVGICSQMYASTNLRSWMNFLSLRTDDAAATYPSKPMWEIESVARKVEAVFEKKFPLVYTAWQKNGRVAP